MSMRNTSIDALVEAAADDPRIVLLTADLGFSVLERFSDRFPDRYFNVGVSEQNMLGMATGMAASGLVPYVYSMTTFVTMRAFEFIRNGASLHQLPVRLIGVGGGFDYGASGSTHHGLEDVALMRALQGVTVYAPLTDAHAREILLATQDAPGPVYYRISKDRIDLPEGAPTPCADGRGLCLLRPGADAVLIGLGRCCLDALRAADLLAEQGVKAAVYGAWGLAPAPETALAEALRGARACATIEDHSVNGGLGSLVAEAIAENGLACRLARFGARGVPSKVCADTALLKELNNITGPAIAAAVAAALAA